jgi:hypothetical protein
VEPGEPSTNHQRNERDTNGIHTRQSETSQEVTQPRPLGALLKRGCKGTIDQELPSADLTLTNAELDVSIDESYVICEDFIRQFSPHDNFYDAELQLQPGLGNELVTKEPNTLGTITGTLDTDVVMTAATFPVQGDQASHLCQPTELIPNMDNSLKRKRDQTDNGIGT